MIRLVGRILIHAFFWGAFTILRWPIGGVCTVGGSLIRFAKRFDS